MRYRALILPLLLAAFFFNPLSRNSTNASSRQAAAPANDDAARIKDEAVNHSQLMDTLSYLTEVIGPRLTNSPNYRRAATWTRDKLASWELSDAHLEPWGPFGRGWSLQSFSAQVVEPQAIPLIAYPKAWSPGTPGEVVAEAIYVNAKTEEDLHRFKGKLRGKIVLTSSLRSVSAHFEPLATRWTAEDMLKYADDEPYPPDNPVLAPQPTPAEIARGKFSAQKLNFIAVEGAAAILEPSFVADGGTIAVMSASVPQPADTPSNKRIRPWAPDAPRIAPQIVVAVEHYNRILRMLDKGEKVKLAMNLSVRFHDEDLMSSHTIAEIPGSDLKDEVVMIGAHLDSWHAGTGATDNGAGVAVMMETVRILQALKLKPRRTIRIALWGGEEQAGGSRFYVEKHFGKWETSNDGGGQSERRLMKTPEYDRFSAYFNFDAGTGKVRGVFLGGNEGLRPILRPWLKPFEELGASTLTINGDWGSDFAWFDQIGLPVVNFIQDEIEYETRTHHTNQDVLDRIQPGDLKQAAAVMTYFVYQTAMRNEKLPRKTIR